MHLYNFLLPSDDGILVDRLARLVVLIDGWCKGLAKLWRVDRFVDERCGLRKEVVDAVVNGKGDDETKDPGKGIKLPGLMIHVNKIY